MDEAHGILVRVERRGQGARLLLNVQEGDTPRLIAVDVNREQARDMCRELGIKLSGSDE